MHVRSWTQLKVGTYNRSFHFHECKTFRLLWQLSWNFLIHNNLTIPASILSETERTNICTDILILVIFVCLIKLKTTWNLTYLKTVEKNFFFFFILSNHFLLKQLNLLLLMLQEALNLPMSCYKAFIFIFLLFYLVTLLKNYLINQT